MDIVMEKLERLSRRAAERADPRPLDVSGIMAAIRDLDVDDGFQAIPLGLLTGGAVAAAAAAVVVAALALAGWNDFSTPLPSVESLLDISDFLL